jgi:Flp pilus assembly protein CpaB
VLVVSGESARPLLENISVLSIPGRNYGQPPTGEAASTSRSSSECILLQVTCEEACRLAAAQESGKVELLLRPREGP